MHHLAVTGCWRTNLQQGLLLKMATLHLLQTPVPCQTLGNPSGIFLISHCFGIRAIRTVQIDWTDIVDKQKIGGARELCRATLGVRSAVSVLSHDTAVQSWEARQPAMFCKLPDSMRSAIGVYVIYAVCVCNRVGGTCTCNLRNSVAARWPFQIFSFFNKIVKYIFNCQIY